ncbi:hypothetical protein POM88_004737 [Heracleum sosnowskyi]|uniref:Leucine-rich repeat-containing N-terminal plant-type domain-containing protein n=1 Tax=Heracleum sosnowskyi TaxID=360622 RepID=A0AAD8JM98_9APIA|nr:hypothetical protein POM88_004737 [Heracleum sosnowskyi]
MSKPQSLIILLVPSIFMLMLMQCFSCPAYQKQSLLQFKSSVFSIFNSSNSSSETSFFGLESWNFISDCCKWDGVVFSSRSRAITTLYLSSLLLMPTQDPMVPVLVDSRVLDPVFRIRSLMLLDVSSNGIQGEISGKGLKNLTKLVHLDMRHNSFNGSIPAELFHLRFLQFFDLSINSLEGGLSSEVGKLENLRTLNLDGNLLGGSIPEHIVLEMNTTRN